MTAHCKKPRDEDWQKILKGSIEIKKEADARCDNRSPGFHQCKAIAESVPRKRMDGFFPRHDSSGLCSLVLNRYRERREESLERGAFLFSKVFADASKLEDELYTSDIL